MIKGDYDLLKRLAMINVCAKCGQPVVVAWDGKLDSYVLKCHDCGYPEALTRQPSLTELWKQGEELPQHIVDNMKRGSRRRQQMEVKQVIPFTLGDVPSTDLATGQELGEAARQDLINYAHKYRLDPYRSHVVIMYSKPYITLDGYLYFARHTGVPYTLHSRPMTTDELQQYHVGTTDHGWIATVSFPHDGTTFNGTGIVTYEEMTEKSPRDNTKLRSPVVAAKPWQLAQKRAEWQAMRRAFPIGETQELEGKPPGH